MRTQDDLAADVETASQADHADLVLAGPEPVLSGTVKWYNRLKRYGFVTCADFCEYFVHATGLPIGARIRQGDSVQFRLRDGLHGKEAHDLVVIQPTAEDTKISTGSDNRSSDPAVGVLVRIAATLAAGNARKPAAARRAANDLRRLAGTLEALARI